MTITNDYIALTKELNITEKSLLRKALLKALERKQQRFLLQLRRLYWKGLACQPYGGIQRKRRFY